MAVFATIASAEVVGNTSLGFGSVKAIGSVDGYKDSMTTQVKSLKTNIGYDFGNIRALGYVQLDKYSDEVISDTEGNAISYGLEAEYIHAVNQATNVFINGLIGRGYKDLGSDGDSVGISNADFNDKAVSVGLLHNIGEIDLRAGLEYKKRNYDTLLVNGYSIKLDEVLKTVFIGACYKF